MSDPEQARVQWADAALWLAKADDDVRMAELALAAVPPVIDPAAFHCQQAVEKIIRALLPASVIASEAKQSILDGWIASSLRSSQ